MIPAAAADPAALGESAETAARLAAGPGFLPALARLRAQARRVGPDFDLNMGLHIGAAHHGRLPAALGTGAVARLPVPMAVFDAVSVS